jgi:hypothetical protein
MGLKIFLISMTRGQVYTREKGVVELQEGKSISLV